MITLVLTMLAVRIFLPNFCIANDSASCPILHEDKVRTASASFRP